MPVKTHRRYCLLKAHAASDEDATELAKTWLSKQAAIAGTALADDFPTKSQLEAAHYSTVEDIDGADEDELVIRVGITRAQAAAAIAAIGA